MAIAPPLPQPEFQHRDFWLLRVLRGLLESGRRLLEDPDHRLAVWLTDLGKSFDSWLRTRDWKSMRTFGGWIDRRWPGLAGHSWIGLVPFLALLGFLVLGPTLKLRGVLGVGTTCTAMAITLAGYWWWGRTAPEHPSRVRRSGRIPFRIQTGVVLLLWLLLYVRLVAPPLWTTWSEPLGPADDPAAAVEAWSGLPQEAGEALYPHSLLWWVVLLLLVAAAAPYLASWLVGKHQRLRPHLLARLPRADLFDRNDPPRMSVGSILRSVAVTPLYQPIHLLYGPALWVVLTGSRQWDRLLSCRIFPIELDRYCGFWAVLAVWWLVLGFARASPRLGAMWTALNRTLFRGGLFSVSSTVVLVAAAQVFDFQYVSTVVEGASTLVWKYLAAAYLTFWVFEYWVNRAICLRLLRLLKPPRIPLVEGQVPYDFDGSNPRTRVAADGRRIQLHGAARFAVVGYMPQQELSIMENRFQPSVEMAQDGGRREVWNFYEKLDLFDAIVDRQPTAPLADRAARADAARTEILDDTALRTQLSDLRQAVESYFLFLNAAVLAILIGVGTFAYQWPRRPAAIVRQPASLAQHVDLRERLVAPAGQAADQPAGRAVLLAASGGGTRAALYTLSVLEGLKELNALRDVELVSGCSGGGASLAYFATHRETLLKADTNWDPAYVHLGHPFITEVVNGSLEARMAYGAPLGDLLAESFARQFHPPAAEGAAVPFATFADARPAVILNTTLCGQFTPSPEFGSWDRRHDGRLASSAWSGGRLIFTNLNQAAAFPQPEQGLPPDAPNEWLPYVVIQDGSAPLLRAAALGANFPPVFPNAAVDAPDLPGGPRRYWVTDGGAMDNRGLVSLLYALRHALKEQAALPESERRPLKELQIVVAEASAGTEDYQHDRGIHAAASAKALLANGLIRELWHDVQRLYCQLDGPRLELHYLAMPTVFRFRGGLGTHWMLPASVTLTEPTVPDETQAVREVLERDEVVALIRGLHQPPATPDPSERSEVCKVRRWAQNDPYSAHAKNWQRLRESLQRKK